MKSKDVELKCICCGVRLEYISDGDSVPEVDMWKNAGVHDFIPGFGSRHDMSDMIVGICDDCIKKKLETEQLIKK